MGRKPVRGGKPPSERRIMGNRAVRRGALVEVLTKVLRVVAVAKFIVKKAAEVIAMYTKRARRARDGESWTTIIIQPR